MNKALKKKIQAVDFSLITRINAKLVVLFAIYMITRKYFTDMHQPAETETRAAIMNRWSRVACLRL